MLAVTWITEVILELIHAKNLDSRRDAFIRSKPNGFGCLILMTLNNFGLIVKTVPEDLLEGKSGASSRGNSSSNSVY